MILRENQKYYRFPDNFTDRYPADEFVIWDSWGYVGPVDVLANTLANARCEERVLEGFEKERTKLATFENQLNELIMKQSALEYAHGRLTFWFVVLLVMSFIVTWSVAFQ